MAKNQMTFFWHFTTLHPGNILQLRVYGTKKNEDHAEGHRIEERFFTDPLIDDYHQALLPFLHLPLNKAGYARN